MAKKLPRKVDQAGLDLIRDYKTVFGSERGQRVLYDLMKKCHFLRPTHVPNDPEASRKNEGQREALLYIMEMLNKDEKAIFDFIMEREKISREDQNALVD